MTDLRHVGQLLHRVAVDERLGTTALAGWLRARIRAAVEEGGDEERTRRLESDADAVQVLTIHRSKGLEFPIVYCPFLWDTIWRDDKVADPVVFHDDDGAARSTSRSRARLTPRTPRVRVTEEDGEELRLAYVALTRARHQAVIWWAGTRDTCTSPLSRLAFAREEDGTVRPRSDVPSDEDAAERFRRLGEAAAGCIAVERCDPGPLTRWQRPAPPDRRALDRALRPRNRPPLAPHVLQRDHWRYPRPGRDERAGGAATRRRGARRAAGRERRRPTRRRRCTTCRRSWATCRAARGWGRSCTTCSRRSTSLRPTSSSSSSPRWRANSPAAHSTWAIQPRTLAGMRAVLETPLGTAAGGVRLADIATADRLDELEFELPLVGGDMPSGHLTLNAVADLLHAHVPAGTPLHGYADRLRDERLQRDLRGYLTGSIDAVLRLPGDRFAIVDYKTNRLAGPDEPLTAWHYRPAALDAAMQDSHYGLQALLYTVALHRYLRWRLADYDPDRHLAGVLYLFVRGMVGADTPVVDGDPCGVFTWQPSRALVGALSDVLDLGAVPA